MRVVKAHRVKQPALPTFYREVLGPDGQMVQKRFRWPKLTQRWWKEWAESPLSNDFTETDWSYLMDTALLHAQYWLGNMKVAPELRLRVAKFGATPEDKARLRIVFAFADDAENPDRDSAPGNQEAGSARSRARERVLRAVAGED